MIVDINGSFEQTNGFDDSGWGKVNFATGDNAPDLPNEYNLERAEAGASEFSLRQPGRHSFRMKAENRCFDAGAVRTVRVGKGAVCVLSGWGRAWCARDWGQRSNRDVNVAFYLGLDLGDGKIKWQQLPDPHFWWEVNQWPASAPWANGVVTGVALTDDIKVYLRSNVGWVGVQDAGGPPCRWAEPQMCAFWDDVQLDVTMPETPPTEPPLPSGKKTWLIEGTVGGIPLAATIKEL